MKKRPRALTRLPLWLCLSLWLWLPLWLPASAAPLAGATGSSEARAVEDLRAFAKLYGHVRFFHPSDEAAEVDWEAFAVHGAEQVLALGEEGDLAALLEELFLPVAPTLRLYPAGTEPPAPTYEWPEETEGLEVVAWQHVGVGLGPGLYRSSRTGRVTEIPVVGAGFGTVTQGLPAEEHRGQRIRLRAAVRAEVEDTGQAQLWLRIDRPDRRMGFFDNMGDRPIRSREWGVYEIEGTVAEDAESIYFGGFLAGKGEAWLDAFELAVAGEDGAWQPVAVKNPGFEEGDRVSGWGAASPGYDYRVVDASYEGEKSVRISAQVATITAPLFDALPKPGEAIRKEIGAGLAIDLPLALWSDEESTLGKRPDHPASRLASALEAVDLTDRDTADPVVYVGAVVIAWNVFQHFYPYFDVVEVDWDAELTARLHGALEARGAREQYHNLRRLTAALDDGHANVYHAGLEATRAGLPLRFEWIEEQIVVTASGAEGVERGDVLVSIDGVPARLLLAREMELRSGSPWWKRHVALSMLARGEAGSEARLVVRRGDAEHTAAAPRSAEAAPPREFEREKIERLEGGVYYVDLRAASIQEIQAVIDELAAAPGVVFDLRGYPNSNHGILGHMIDEPARSAKWNVPRTIYPDREKPAGWDTSGRWTLPPAEPRLGGALAFLTDGSAISYAESVMGIVEAYELAAIVGQPTAGANGNVNPFQLPGGYRVTWTGMKVLKHDDSQHHLVGIRPTVPAERTIAGVRAGRDELLERALEILRPDA